MPNFTLYRADPSTGEVFETKEVDSVQEKERLLRDGDWMETPRWKRNPRPHGGGDISNPFERQIQTPYVEYPRMLHKRGGKLSDGSWEVKTLIVKDEAAKDLALKGGWCMSPDDIHKGKAEKAA